MAIRIWETLSLYKVRFHCCLESIENLSCKKTGTRCNNPRWASASSDLSVKTFGNYYEEQLFFVQNVKRIDIVFNKYQQCISKQYTRESRGSICLT